MNSNAAFALEAGLPCAAPPKTRFYRSPAPAFGSGIAGVNSLGLPGLVGAFFEDALSAAMVGEVCRPELPLGPNGESKGDLELVGFDTFLEVKAGTTADPMRFPVSQLEDYLWHREQGGHETLYCFTRYRGKNRDGQRTTLAALGGERGRHAVRRLHDHLVQETQHMLILDAQIVAGMARSLRDEVGPCYPGKTVNKVSRLLHTVVDAAFNGDARGRSIIADFAPDARNWRRVVGSLPLGGYGEMFADRDARRRVPVTAIFRASHADRLIRDGGPLSRIFPESSLPKSRYRSRIKIDPSLTPF